MIRSIFKKCLAISLCFCMLFSVCAIGVSAVTDPPAAPAVAPSIWKTSAKGFGVNKLYATGLVAVGTLLTKLAASTECEELEKIVSFINVWVCGGNPTTQTLAEIKALCNQILNELKRIEQKMDSYANYFATQDAQNKYDLLVEKMNKAWTEDVEDTISAYGLHSAMQDFFEYEDLTDKTTGDTNTVIGYVAAASCFENGEKDKYGHTYTEAEVLEKRKKLFDDFCQMHGNIPSNANTNEKRAEYLFATNYIDSQMQSAIRQLSFNITKTDSYADRCAQVAYQSMPNLSDQYEFVINGVNRQFMQICMVEMLYQEYLSMRGEYLEYKYSQAMESKDKETADALLAENKAMWEVYYNDIDLFAQCNEELLGYMENRITKPLQLNTFITLALDKYITPEDMGSIILKNKDYKSRTDSDDRLNNFNGYESGAVFTVENMFFNRVAVPTTTGIDTYYIFDVTTYNNYLIEEKKENVKPIDPKTFAMIHRFDHNALDLYYSSCDAYNLRLCTYTDGINSFNCPSSPAEVQSLYQTDSFAFYASTPHVYLSEYLSYVPQNSRVYQFFTKSEIDYTADGILTDDHIIYDTLDMENSYIGFDVSQNLVEKVNGKVVYEKDYTKKGYDKNTYDSYYSVILKEQSEQLKNTLSLSVTGEGQVQAYITDKNGNQISNGAQVVCGTDLTLWINPSDDTTILDSLTRYKSANPLSTEAQESSTVLLEGENFYSLKTDEDTGYYKLDFTMPYSNTRLELKTSKGYSISYINCVENTPVTFSAYQNAHKADDNINLTYNGRLNHIYLLTKEGVTPVELTYNYALNNSCGSFKMPQEDVTLLVISNCFTETVYSLPELADGKFLISDYEDLVCMSAFINSGNPKYAKAQYVLANDIDMTGKIWNPVNSFEGTFDGNGYIIKGLNSDASAEDGNRHPLFCVIEKDAVVRNLIIDDADIFSDDYYVIGAGAVSKQNFGTIENCLVKNSGIQLGNWNYLGGITGYNAGSIKNCGIADSSLTRRWGGTSAGSIGGLTQENDGYIENCFVYNCRFTNGTLQNNVMIVSGQRSPFNSFYTPAENAKNNYYTETTVSAFSGGEVAYLLNNGVTDGTQSWYQNLDTDDADAYPVPVKGHGTVYKWSDSSYANSPDISSVTPPVHGGEHTTPTNPGSTTDKSEDVNKDVVNTGMGIPFALIFSLTALAVLAVVFARKKQTVK